MVEFEYQPYSKVIIHEIVKIPFDTLILSRCIGIPDGGVARPMRWANGFTFDIAFMHPTDDLVNEQMKGITRWAALSYADMEEFKEIIQGDRAIKIPVLKAVAVIFNELGDWLRSEYEPSLNKS